MRHDSIMVKEVLEKIGKKKNNIIDCTFGFGGHALEILKLNKKNFLLSFEIDKKYFLFFFEKKKVKLFNKCFTEIDKINKKIDIIIVDLGFSRNQILNPSTGISKKKNFKLNANINKNKIYNSQLKIKNKLKINKKYLFLNDFKFKNFEYFFYKIRNFVNRDSQKLEIILKKSIKILNPKGKIIIICYNYLEICNLVFFKKNFSIFIKTSNIENLYVIEKK